MPTDIMSGSCRTERFGQSFNKKSCDAEVKSGFVVLSGLGRIRQDVRVVVYRTSLEHFAVIYPRKRLSKPIGVVNLRNTSVERAGSEMGLVIRQKGYDNTISAKFLCAERDVDSWITAFTARSSPACQHQTSLPVLMEAEETYDNWSLDDQGNCINCCEFLIWMPLRRQTKSCQLHHENTDYPMDIYLRFSRLIMFSATCEFVRRDIEVMFVLQWDWKKWKLVFCGRTKVPVVSNHGIYLWYIQPGLWLWVTRQRTGTMSRSNRFPFCNIWQQRAFRYDTVELE